MGDVIDADQHLFEAQDVWARYIDPDRRDDALAITEDDRGYSWLTWRNRRLDLADVHQPGDTAAIGEQRRRYRDGLPARYSYGEALPVHYRDPSARLDRLAPMGVDSAVLFPNFGLLWERRLSEDLPALTANMGAWNRWCGEVAVEGMGRLLPVAHLTLSDPEWLSRQLRALGDAGVRLGMIAPAASGGRPLSHPAHDGIWALFIENGVTPVFHVADQPRVIDDAFYTDPEESFVSVMESVMIWVPAAVAVTDLIVNGTFERFPALRVGIFELSSAWVPLYLLMLDGAWDFTTTLNGWPLRELGSRPSDYMREHVRVASFSYENPARLAAQCGDIFMFCSDYPHGEGTATPREDYAKAGCIPEEAVGLYGKNLRYLLDGAR